MNWDLAWLDWMATAEEEVKWLNNIIHSAKSYSTFTCLLRIHKTRNVFFWIQIMHNPSSTSHENEPPPLSTHHLFVDIHLLLQTLVSFYSSLISSSVSSSSPSMFGMQKPRPFSMQCIARWHSRLPSVWQFPTGPLLSPSNFLTQLPLSQRQSGESSLHWFLFFQSHSAMRWQILRPPLFLP